MNHGPIVISEDGFKAMNFSADFNKFAKEHNIRDPFEVSRKLFSKRCHHNKDGSMSVDFEIDDETGKIKEDAEEPSRAEKDAWIKMRDEYIASRCFYEIGYDSFLFHTKPHDYENNYDVSYMRGLDEFVPCRSADAQCMLTCHRFVDCGMGRFKPE